MLKVLSQDQLLAVAGGCPQDICKEATLNLLHSCSMEEMIEVNKIFKFVLLSDEMKGADSDTKIAALIAAIQNSSL